MNFPKIHIMLITVFLIMLWCGNVSASQSEAELILQKKSIGVGPVECIDCTSGVQDKASFIRKTISDKMSERLILEVLPIEDIDKTASSLERGSGEPLTSWALRIGTLAGVEKIVFVTIREHEKKFVTDKTLRFQIIINVLDVKTANIEISQPVETDFEEDFEQIFINAGDSIARVYRGHSEITEKIDASITLSFLYPQADLREKGAGNGYGLMFNLYMNWPAWLLLTTGFYKFNTEKPNIDSLYMIPFGIHMPYYLPLTLGFKLIPSIGVGGLVSIMYYDELEYRASGLYEYQMGYFFNPMLTARLETNYLFLNRYDIVVTPSFSYVVGEEGRKGLIYSLDVGLKIQF